MTICQLLDSYGIKWVGQGHRHSSKGWIQLNCPNCDQGDPDGFHLGLNIRGKYLSCWKCGYLPISKTLADLGLPWDETFPLLKGLPEAYQKEIKPKGSFAFPKGIHYDLLPIHKNYLKKRGFKPDYLKNIWNLMSIGMAKRLAWRILIPVNYQQIAVSYTTRSTSDEGARYLNARPEDESISIKTLLYGHDHVRHSAIVVEGPFDAMRIGPGAVATLGTSYTQAQLLKLSKIPVRTICFDSEPIAQRRARKLADALSVFPGQTKIVTLDAKDPGSASKREIKLLRKEFLK